MEWSAEVLSIFLFSDPSMKFPLHIWIYGLPLSHSFAFILTFFFSQPLKFLTFAHHTRINSRNCGYCEYHCVETIWMTKIITSIPTARSASHEIPLSRKIHVSDASSNVNLQRWWNKCIKKFHRYAYIWKRYRMFSNEWTKIKSKQSMTESGLGIIKILFLFLDYNVVWGTSVQGKSNHYVRFSFPSDY